MKARIIIGIILFMLGLGLMILSIVLQSSLYRCHEIKDCYDNQNNKIIGIQCIDDKTICERDKDMMGLLGCLFGFGFIIGVAGSTTLLWESVK